MKLSRVSIDCILKISYYTMAPSFVIRVRCHHPVKLMTTRVHFGSMSTV